MNFHTDVYRSISNDLMERLKKEAYENNSFYKKERSKERKMKKNLFLSLILQLRRAK